MATKVFELYDGSVIANFIEGNHRYRIMEPSEYAGWKQGVTTILRVLNKPELLQWAANQACDTLYKAYQELEPEDFWSEKEFNDLLRTARYAHMTYKDAKAKIGTDVHSWIEQHIAGQDTDYDELMKPSVEAFLRWEEKVKPEYIFSEKLLYSKEHDYCGTMDSCAIIGGKTTVIDFKTGSPDKEYNERQRKYTGQVRGRTEHFIQEGAYAIPLKEELGIDCEQAMTLYLPNTGGAYAFYSPFVDFWQELFTGILGVHRSLQKANRLNEYEYMKGE